MAGQLRMTEEEKKAKMKVKYDQEIDEMQAKLETKGLSFIELAKQYGSEVQLGNL